MPKYNLRCMKCNGEYNIHASMAEKSEKRILCPDCGSCDMETIFKTPPAYVKNMGETQCPRRGSCGSNCPMG